MISAQLAQLYEFTYFTLMKNTDGVTHETSLRSPEPSGNCMNWVLGHIVAQRVPILRLAGEEPVWGEAEVAFYQRGSSPVAGERRQEALPFDRLVADLTRTQDRLKAALERITPERLEAPGFPQVPGGLQPVGTQLAVFNFHEAYHAGQIGLLRRLVGLPGAIQ